MVYNGIPSAKEVLIPSKQGSVSNYNAELKKKKGTVLIPSKQGSVSNFMIGM